MSRVRAARARWVVVGLASLGAALGLGMRASVHAQAGCEASVISAPRSGEVLEGAIEVLGSATIGPFNFYKVEWAAREAPESWIAVSEVVEQPVRNGSLDLWRTGDLPEGVYRLKLTVVDQSHGEACRFVVEDLRLGYQAEAEGSEDRPAMNLPSAPASQREGASSGRAPATPDAAEASAGSTPVMAEEGPGPGTPSGDGRDEGESAVTPAANEEEGLDAGEQGEDPEGNGEQIGEQDDGQDAAVEPTARATVEPVLPQPPEGERSLTEGLGKRFLLGLLATVVAGAGLAALLMRR